MNLVFASGFLVPQQLLGIDYFRGVRTHLAGRHDALFPVVSPLASSKKRARELADAIQQKYPAGPVHIIAHSMGGLDSRALIAANHHGLSDPGRIASLTTLSTPHRGSPVADLLAGPTPDGLRRVIYETIRRALDHVGVPTGALANLTTESASEVPDVVLTHPHIRYRSCCASGRSGSQPTSLPLALTYHYIHDVTGQANDGVVTPDSARYGEADEPPWPCDHVDMVGYDLDRLPVGDSFNHLAAIDAVISRL